MGNDKPEKEPRSERFGSLLEDLLDDTELRDGEEEVSEPAEGK